MVKDKQDNGVSERSASWIDPSDEAPLGAEFFARAKLHKGGKPVQARDLVIPNRKCNTQHMGYALTIKGQVTLPKRVREHLRLKPGDEVDFTIRPDGAVTVVAARKAAAAKDRWAAALGTWQGPPADEWLMATRGPPDETGEQPPSRADKRKASRETPE